MSRHTERILKIFIFWLQNGQVGFFFIHYFISVILFNKIFLLYLSLNIWVMIVGQPKNILIVKLSTFTIIILKIPRALGMDILKIEYVKKNVSKSGWTMCVQTTNTSHQFLSFFSQDVYPFKFLWNKSIVF